MAARIVQRRRLNHPDKRRGLGRRDLMQVLVEEVTRRQRHPGDRSAVVRAHRDVVDIALEDLVLAEPYLDHQRDRQLAHLARERALVAVDKSARELLGQRARALAQTMRAEVGDCRLDHPYRVEARMIVEIAILGREQAAHQVRRNIAQLTFDPLGRCSGQQTANDLGFHLAAGSAVPKESATPSTLVPASVR